MSRPLDPRLLRAVPAARRLVVALGALQTVGALLTVVQAGLLADVVVGAVQHHRSGADLAGRLVLVGAVGAGRALLAAAQEWVAARASVRIRAGVRRQVLDAIVRMGPAGAAELDRGRLATAAAGGLDGLDGYFTRALPALVGALVVPPIVLLRIGTVDWQSLLLLVLMLPLVPVFMALVGLMTRRRMDRQYRVLERLSGQFLDLVQGLTTLKVYGQARRQVRTVERATDTYRRVTMSTLRMAFLSGLVLDLIATLSVAVVAVDIGLRLDHGHLGLTAALVVLLLAPEVFAPLRAVGAQHHAAEEGRAALDAAFGVIESAPAPAAQGIAVTATTGAIRFRGATVSYPQRGGTALDALDLDITPATTVVLQGRSGAGKTTVLSTLLGWVAADGIVEVGTESGMLPLRDLDQESWRAHLAWVPQRPRLTQRTVFDEVALGDPDADGVRVHAAIERCHAPAPATLLGENAIAISAGQCRRVALARALLRAWRQLDRGAVPILLLDEPSEDLDARTEQVVASVLAGLTGRATIVFTSHSARLAAIAQRRVEIADGRVVRDIAQTPVPVVTPDDDLVLQPRAAAETYEAARLTMRDVARVVGLRGSVRRLAGAGALSGAAGLSALALTGTSIWLICRAAQHPNVQALAIAVVGVRTFALSRALLRYAERLVSHDGALRLLAVVRARVFRSLEPLVPFGVADLRRGDLLRRFVADVDGVQEGLVRAVVPLTGAAITCAGAVLLAAALAPGAGIALAAGLGVGLVVAPQVSRTVARAGGAVAHLSGTRDAEATALVDGLPELVAFGAADRAVATVAGLDARIERSARRTALATAAGVALTGLAAAATMPAALAATASESAAGRLSAVSVGVVVACVLVGFEALAPLPPAFAAWSRFRAGVERVAALLGRPAPLPEPAHATDMPFGATGLHASGVSVAPAAGAGDVVRHTELAVRPGESVAITGSSGSGKSTLLAALLRLAPVTGGEIDVRRDRSAVPLPYLGADELPPLAAGSLQGDHVFDASLGDNLRVVRPDATDDELVDAAARAGLGTFVQDLPDGWRTPAGVDGAALSGGQRQRLLLARALLADPEVLVLDEPTAHLDPDTEREVLTDLFRGTRGRTMIVTTHRTAAVSTDCVLALVDGALYPRRESA